MVAHTKGGIFGAVGMLIEIISIICISYIPDTEFNTPIKVSQK